MYKHHEESIEKLKEYFLPMKGMIAIVLDGSIVKGNERPDSDIDALIVVTEETYAELAAQNRLAEVIPGHCTYEGGYFDSNTRRKRSWKKRRNMRANPRATHTSKRAFCTRRTRTSHRSWKRSPHTPNTNGKQRSNASTRTCSSTAAIFCTACPRKTPTCARTLRRRSYTVSIVLS